MKRKTGFLVALIFCTVLFMSCATKGGKENITVYGMIYDSENNPVQDYSIVINDKMEAVSDFGGRFVIYDVQKGLCRITGKKAGYSSSDETLYLDGKKIVYLRVQNLEEQYAGCFSLMEKGDYDMAEKAANSILSQAAEDETAICFLSVIEILKNLEVNTEETVQEEAPYEI